MGLTCVKGDGFRRVNEREKDALTFTFAKAVGDYLIDIIRIEYDPTLARTGFSGAVKGEINGKTNKTHISMRSDYNPENLSWLGTFIHEAVHIWQRNTGLHQEGRAEQPRDYTYYYTDLPTLELKVEEHAEAVKTWFYVTYGLIKGLKNWSYEADRIWLWQRALEGFGFDPQDAPIVKLELDALQKLLDIWIPVIEEIRDQDLVPALRPKGPDPKFP